MEDPMHAYKRRKEMPAGDDYLQGTSFGLNFVTYHEYQALKLEHEGLKEQLRHLKENLIGDLHKSLSQELDAIKKENKHLKDEIYHLRKSIFERANTVKGDQTNINAETNGTQSDDEIESFAMSGRVDKLEEELATLKSIVKKPPPMPTSETISFMKNLVTFYDNGVDNANMAANSLASELSALPQSTPDLSRIPPDKILQQRVLEEVDWDQPALTPSKPPPDDSNYSQKVQLLMGYNIWVNRSKLHAHLKEAELQGTQGPAYVLRRVMMLVFSLEEMANSRGQGIMQKTSDNVELMQREPLDPVKVQACKEFMRKWCLEHGLVEPTDKAVNTIITHQITYARTKLKRMANKMKSPILGMSASSFDMTGQLMAKDVDDMDDSTGSVTIKAENSQQQQQ